VTTVCFVTAPGTDPRDSLLQFETARQALSPYEITEPYANAICIETVSLGAAIALLDDLAWYLRRSIDEAIIREPSVSEAEWLSKELAVDLRNERRKPADTHDFVKIFGIDDDNLVEPMYAERREDGTLPGYDLREVDETLVVRISDRAFGG